MTLRYNAHLSSGDFNGILAGSEKTGNAVDVGDGQRQKIRGLSALVIALADTNTMTVTAKWEVSNDGSTWLDLANEPQNPAGVAIATGTAGADTAVTKVIPAPEAVYGWRKARLALVVGVATGAAGDTWSIGYSYRTNRHLSG